LKHPKWSRLAKGKITTENPHDKSIVTLSVKPQTTYLELTPNRKKSVVQSWIFCGMFKTSRRHKKFPSVSSLVVWEIVMSKSGNMTLLECHQTSMESISGGLVIGTYLFFFHHITIGNNNPRIYYYDLCLGKMLCYQLLEPFSNHENSGNWCIGSLPSHMK
jgi:hypothetical protein